MSTNLLYYVQDSLISSLGKESVEKKS